MSSCSRTVNQKSWSPIRTSRSQPTSKLVSQNTLAHKYLNKHDPGVAQHISSMVRPRKLTASQTRDRRVVFLRGHGKAHGKAHGVGVRVASGRDHDA